MKVIALTLNPAYDRYLKVDDFAAGKENSVSEDFVCVGGKGVNICRALSAFGADAGAFTVLGRENCGEYEKFLKKENIDCENFYTDSRIRENITIISTPDGTETRISYDSFKLDPQTLFSVLSAVCERADEDTVVTLSGRIPDSVSTDAIVEFARALKLAAPRLVLDSSSLDSDCVSRIAPWLVKPNERELKLLTGCSPDRALEGARLLCDAGCDHVLCTLGADGALYCGIEGEYRITAPKIMALSTVGAGDSAIAGFLYSFGRGDDFTDVLKYAVAFGSAACLREGTNPPDPADVETLIRDIKIFEI